jgi:hypothetical protein
VSTMIRPSGPSPHVDRAAVKRAAVDVADRPTVGLREIVMSGGLDGAAEHLTDRPLAVIEHRRGPVWPGGCRRLRTRA